MYPVKFFFGTWEYTPGKGTSFSKPSFSGSMLNFGGVFRKPQWIFASLSNSDHLWVINLGWLGIMWCQLCLPILSGRWIYISRWWFQIFLVGGFEQFLFSPGSLGRWSNLTHIFQMGWNHQLDFLFSPWKLEKYGEMIQLDQKWFNWVDSTTNYCSIVLGKMRTISQDFYWIWIYSNCKCDFIDPYGFLEIFITGQISSRPKTRPIFTPNGGV